MFTTQSKKRWCLSILLILMLIIGLLPANPTLVQAAEPEEVPFETIALRPEGITIDLFDYWSTRSEGDPDGGGNMVNDSDKRYNLGINEDHYLKFGQGMGQVMPPEKNDEAQNASEVETASKQGEINKWTNGARPMAGIVNNTLDSNGYPTLAYTEYVSQSLGYLFDSSYGAGKTAYTNVGGLLRQDENGYYYYNSATNFAEFHESKNGEKNVFTVYNQNAVTGAGASGTGMFFPFNTKEQVFGNYLQSTDDVLNHYFGLHMTTSFQQTKSGVSPSDNNTPVTFSFSGDDDVWIFIDDVLVADLGGIHDACSVEINFQTGAICVYKDANKNGTFDNGDKKYNVDNADSLNDMFIKAGKDTEVTWSGQTFADETYHTLDFFYLERGNVDSNMKMKYNLKTVPESDLVKVDQDGKPVANAEFKLYETDSTYTDTTNSDRSLVATGTTDADGVFTFKKTDGDVLSLSQLDSTGHYLLVETKVPEGYRIGTEPIKLYVKSADGKNLLLSDNEWDTGAYAMPKVRVSALTNGSGEIQEYNVNDGLIVAAVFKGDDVKYGQTELNGLSLVYGDPVKGWNMAEGDSAAAQLKNAASAMNNTDMQGIYAFALDSSGAYSADIENLPGDINKYSWMVNATKEGTAEYMGAYFFVKDAHSVSDIANANVNDISLLNSTSFDRDFSVRLYAPNIENRLLVQKVATGTTETLDGVTFELYEQEDVTVDQDGNYTQLSGNPLDVATLPTNGKTGTVKVDESAQVEGALAFYGIPKGEYYLVETEGTADYNINKTAIPVVVDESGVHVNAGDADDNVAVRLGVGKLVKSMVQFAVDDGIDATLHDINAELQSATEYKGVNTVWTSEDSAESLQLSYSQDADILEYGPTTAGNPVTLSYDSGWGRLNITQNLNEVNGTPSPDPKQELSDQSLNNLFSGTAMVVVGNDLKAPGDLSITKNVVNGTSADQNREFTVQLTLGAGGLHGGKVVNSATNEEIKFVEGKATLTVKDGETINLDVPNGVTLTVEETGVDQAFTVGYALNDQAQNSPVEVTVNENDQNKIVITNTRTTGTTETLDGATNLKVTKTVEGGDWPENENFKFAITSETKNAPMPDETTIEIGKSADGTNTNSAAFGDIIFNQEGNYVYKIKEIVGTNEELIYDTHEMTVKVTVEPDENGVLVANASTEGNTTFTNTFKGSAAVLDGSSALKVTKKVTNGAWPTDEKFVFKLTAVTDGAPMPANDTIEIAKPADGSKTNSAAFGNITFESEGTYEYKIAEVTGNNDDIIYDTHEMTVTVEVAEDAATGDLVATATTDGNATFTNKIKHDAPPIIDDDDEDKPDPDTPALDRVNHFLYVEGYPEDYRTGEYSDNEDLWPVKPQGNITRAEVATIFYRLLKDEVREEIETDVNSFPDVNKDDWFNITVSSLANMGALSGYEDGTFRPNEPISRAELAAMAVRFYDTFEAEYEEGTFLDVDGDEWYADAIAAAEELGIIGGYPDGTVRPEANITRAETCAIVNRVLERRPHDDHLGDVEDMRTWPDNQPGAWYYADMQEATNGHYYEWIDIDGSKFEEWTEVDKDYDWTKR